MRFPQDAQKKNKAYKDEKDVRVDRDVRADKVQQTKGGLPFVGQSSSKISYLTILLIVHGDQLCQVLIAGLGLFLVQLEQDIGT